MAKSDNDKLREKIRQEKIRREKIRVKFAAHRNKGHSIVAASNLAGISPSTYYAWNDNDAYLAKGGWSKNGW